MSSIKSKLSAPVKKFEAAVRSTVKTSKESLKNVSKSFAKKVADVAPERRNSSNKLQNRKLRPAQSEPAQKNFKKYFEKIDKQFLALHVADESVLQQNKKAVNDLVAEIFKSSKNIDQLMQQLGEKVRDLPVTTNDEHALKHAYYDAVLKNYADYSHQHTDIDLVRHIGHLNKLMITGALAKSDNKVVEDEFDRKAFDFVKENGKF